ncbi:hypothetical protein DXG03_006961 [Asterophora parasitica]|uniref:HSF-type DNA-binding domain-containing protein n=1 Tax=Asterophora parasitica TaxID=117018 RepID=A0A9P7G4V4_9AGAR|nr:hypothetical protein DXG03_006961 [Asterophora parasitica]
MAAGTTMSHLEYTMNTTTDGYPPRQPQQQWQHYPQFPRASTLSLNLSSLSVTSPPSNLPSPSTPLSPAYPPHPAHHQPFHYDAAYDDDAPRPSSSSAPAPSPAASAATPPSSGPRKRAATTTATPARAEYEPLEPLDDAPMDTIECDDIDMRFGPPLSGGSPVENEERLNPPPSMNVIGKPMATNNFVTKLYQMINDAKSAQYIAWTELGTSFVVSNVGEFSRSILGSHFKHNNFSSFVRQLNMYGFHKINRTPRAQRTSSDAQTWEFSHHRFLRGRADLLDEIKRKAMLDQGQPGALGVGDGWGRRELPGEIAAQLGALRDENRRVWEQLAAERKRADRLVGLLSRLWDTVGARMPGNLPPFPTDLLEYDTASSSTGHSPNIYVTSPAPAPSLTVGQGQGQAQAQHRGFPPLNTHALHTLQLHSPSTSPTQTETEFSGHQQQQQLQQHQQPQSAGTGPPPTLSRQHSFQHIYLRNGDVSSVPASPGGSSTIDQSQDIFDEHAHQHPQHHAPEPPQRISAKRPRISTDLDDTVPDLAPGSASVPVSALSSPGGVSTHAHAQYPHQLQHQHQHQHQQQHQQHMAQLHPHPQHINMGNINVGMLNLQQQQQNKKMSRARSDSAPLGYGFGGHAQGHAHAHQGGFAGHGHVGLTGWGAGGAGAGGGVMGGRPRSGSGLGIAGRGVQGPGKLAAVGVAVAGPGDATAAGGGGVQGGGTVAASGAPGSSPGGLVLPSVPSNAPPNR